MAQVRSGPDVQHRLLQPARDVQLVPVAQVRAQRLGRHHAVLEQLQQSGTVSVLTSTGMVDAGGP